MRRREFTHRAAALAALGLPAAAGFAADKATPLKKLGQPQPFDYAWLKGRARALAGRPYVKSTARLPDEVLALDYDRHQAIRYREDHALWGDAGRRFRVKFFHLGMFTDAPVRMHEVADGMAQELAYDPEMFDYGKSGLHASRMPRDLGFAGFRVNFHSDWRNDVAAFQGASYFRAVGGERQYGLSARGLAIDSGGAEEFPRFTDFWLERPAATSSMLTVYALMDSPSVAGAYRFDIHPGDRLVMDVDAALYPRVDIERVGIATLTSMFQHGENDRRMANDWRPEIHDSDGLSMWAGSGEWLWRPLANPSTIRFSAFTDENPRGFGLLQRDRDFDHYQDDGAFYDKRPSLWVEPRGSWGKGTVQLVELPTDDETNDNIVAFWTPAAKPRAGEERLFTYRLHWSGKPPVQPPAARVAATRTGIGGIVGQKRKYVSWRFTIDFEGGDLSLVGDESQMAPVITTSRGTVELTSARPLKSIQGYRAMFDLKLPDESAAPVELRAYLAFRGQPMSETWCYQWTPPPAVR
ncbi:MAG: glucan biosynthesis protein D [Burkholderiaceae bacterium]|nr:glucan biosynthesis protein D [Burkholderiaceae bacterium]